jgi:hypothetical protein
MQIKDNSTTGGRGTHLGSLSIISAVCSFLFIALPAPIAHELIRWEAYEHGQHIETYYYETYIYSSGDVWVSVVINTGLLCAGIGLALGIWSLARGETPRRFGQVGLLLSLCAPFVGWGAVHLYVATRFP